MDIISGLNRRVKQYGKDPSSVEVEDEFEYSENRNMSNIDEEHSYMESYADHHHK